MTTRVHDPKPGYRYSLAVHGEPPEGVEVLWHNDRSGMRMWSGWRAKSDTHWMLSPVDAPVPEEPPFPLSREEFHSWQISDDPDERPGAGTREFKEWIWQLGTTTVFDYEMVQDYWRAAGCPGATPAAEEGEAQEGPWRLSIRNGDHYITRNGLLYIISPSLPERLETIIADANRAHRLGRVLNHEIGKRTEIAECYRKERVHAREMSDEIARVQDALPVAAWMGKGDLPAAVRSLVADLRKAESERDELRSENTRLGRYGEAADEEERALRHEIADLRARLEKAEAELRVRNVQFQNAISNEMNLGRQARKLQAVVDGVKGATLYEPTLRPTDHAACAKLASPSEGRG